MQEIANPNIKFTVHTTNNVTLAGHPGYLLAGTFKRNPSSNALEWFSNIGTIIGNKVYSILYYSPEKTYPVYHPTYLQMIRSFALIPPYMCPPYIVCYPITPWIDNDFGSKVLREYIRCCIINPIRYDGNQVTLAKICIKAIISTASLERVSEDKDNWLRQRFPNQSEVIAHIDKDQPMLGGHHEK